MCLPALADRILLIRQKLIILTPVRSLHHSVVLLSFLVTEWSNPFTGSDRPLHESSQRCLSPPAIPLASFVSPGFASTVRLRYHRCLLTHDSLSIQVLNQI